MSYYAETQLTIPGRLGVVPRGPPLLPRLSPAARRDQAGRPCSGEYAPPSFPRVYPDTQVISCMDGSGCQELFSDSTLARVLSDKTMALYHRLAQAKELELAGISGLESCPFCPFAIVIENPDENLFRCLNEACRQVTCRKCRRLVSLWLVGHSSYLRTTSPSAARKWPPTLSSTAATLSRRPCLRRSSASVLSVPSRTSRSLAATRLS